MKKGQTPDKGFTLIELMIVVAIIGVLAAVAIPSFNAYVDSSRETEAVDGLKAISDGAVAFYNTEHTYDGSEFVRTAHAYPGCNEPYQSMSLCGAEPVPKNIRNDGVKDTVDETLWDVKPWTYLGFSILEPFYFQYSYSNTSNELTDFTAEARANFSTSPSHWSITGNDNGVVSKPVKLDE